MVQEDLAISPGGLYESYFLYIIIFGCKYCQIAKKIHIISTMRLRVRKMAHKKGAIPNAKKVSLLFKINIQAILLVLQSIAQLLFYLILKIK